jgi:SNF2 family DNA or RNA helicase
MIEKSYKLPNIFDHIYECYSYYDNFSHVLSDEARNMLAADDLASAIALLGGQQTNNNDLKEVILQKEKDNLHRLEARLKYYEELNDEKQIENYKNKIDINNKTIKNIEDRIKSMNNECPVCIEEIINKVIVGCCTNAFCDKCILEILKTTSKCPLCRCKLEPSKMLYSNDQIKINRDEEEKKNNCCNEYNDEIEIINQNTNKKVKNNKLKQLIKIVTSKQNGKFIVFSQYNNTFSHIIEELKNSNVSFCELKGSIDRINSILKQFDDGKIKVLFLNSKYNGTGINLQKTTDIIFYHKMPSIIEQQNIGRAMRIGRKDPLHIHRLITRNETIYNNN